jgi:hypothetical protein
MSTPPGSISACCQQFDERVVDIPESENEQLRSLQDPEMKTASVVATQLRESLDRIENGIQTVSSFCMLQLINCSKQLEAIQIDLEQAEGSLNAVRADVGRQRVRLACQLSSPDSAECPAVPRHPKLDLSFPSGTFDLNAGVYNGVGDRPGRPEQRPLIRRIAPGKAPPLFWSKASDFFVSEKRPDFSTSFSEFFGFDGALCFAVPKPALSLKVPKWEVGQKPAAEKELKEKEAKQSAEKVAGEGKVSGEVKGDRRSLKPSARRLSKMGQ